MKLFSVALLSFIVSTCTAQLKADSTQVLFQYGFGYHHQSFNGINSRIQARPEYEQLGSNIFSFNVGYSIEHKKLLFNSCFVFGNSLSGDVDKRSSSISLMSIAFDLGYNFSNNQRIRFYPFAGIGYNAYMAKLNKDVSAISFDSVLQSTTVQQRTETLSFTNGAVCYQAGFGIDLLKRKERYQRSIGIKASYTGGFGRETWRINETQLLQNAPSDKVNQFNVSLQFGIGRSRRSRR